MNFFVFRGKIQTKIAAISRERNFAVRLFGILELLVISLAWMFLSVLFYFPRKLVVRIKARIYAKKQVKLAGENKRFRCIDLREMRPVKVSQGAKLLVAEKFLKLRFRKTEKSFEERWEKFQEEIIHLVHFHVSKKAGKKFAFDIAIASLILVVIFQLSDFGQAATYTNTWTTTADFDSNASTIAKGGQNSSLNLPTTKSPDLTTASNQVQMTQTSAVRTENSFNDFSKGTNTNVVLDNNAIKSMPTALANTWSGPGTIGAGGQMIRNRNDDDVYVLQGNGGTGFYKYSISANAWTTLTVAPGAINIGAAMIRNGSDDSIYVSQGGNATGFYKYSISGNAWTTLTAVPGAIGDSGTMIRNGSDDSIYVSQGNNATGFYKYSIAGNSWTTLAAVPGNVYTGAAMIRNGSDDSIYVSQGGNATGFYKYSISAGTWTTLTVAPGAIGVGGTMIRNGSDDSIYVLQGNNATGFYKYSISAGTWTTLSYGMPDNARADSSIVRGPDGDSLYVLPDGYNYGKDFFKYSMSTGTWTSLAATFNWNDYGSVLLNTSSDSIYLIRGDGTSEFDKYSISGNSWTGMTGPPAALGGAYIPQSGDTMIHNGTEDNIYVLSGGNTNAFYSYSIANNTWTTLATVPGNVYQGGTMIRNGSDDSIYVLQGNNGTGFYKYSISAGTWTTLTTVPGAIGVGAAMIRNGSDDSIYVSQGNNATGFYKYSISAGTWTTLTAAPGAIGLGAAMVRHGGDSIYVLAGDNSTNFYKYSISANAWASMNVPGVVNGGGNMIDGNAGSNIVYVLAGDDGNSNGFYKYNINSSYAPSGTFESQTLDLGTTANLSTLSVPQNAWQKDPNPVVAPSNVYNSNGSLAYTETKVLRPFVLKENGTYKMWYTSSTAALKGANVTYATSTDGLIWSAKIPTNLAPTVGTADSNGVTSGVVINDGGTYKMWYVGQDSYNVSRILYATSADGINWTKGTNGTPLVVLDVGSSGSFDSGGVSTSYVMKDGSTYKMWYSAMDGSNLWDHIGYATSADGINWTKASSSVMNLGNSGSFDDHMLLVCTVLKITNTDWRMFYVGINSSDGTERNGYATSADGINWTRPDLGLVSFNGNTNNNLILDKGLSGASDSGGLDCISVMYDASDGRFKAWTTGIGSVITFGYAELPEIKYQVAAKNNSLSDDFNGASLDTSKWNTPGAGVSQINGRIQMTNTTSSGNKSLVQNGSLAGDFDIEADYDSSGFIPSTGTGAKEQGLVIFNASTNWQCNVQLAGVSGNTILGTNWWTGSSGVTITNPKLYTPQSVGRLKMVRHGSQIDCYGKDAGTNGQWVNFARYSGGSGITDNMTLYLILQNADGSSTASTAYFDNFVQWSSAEGPDGTSSTYFTPSMSVAGPSSTNTPSNLNGSQYVHYLAYFGNTSQAVSTQTLSGVSINYSQYTQDSGKIFEADFNGSTTANYAAGSPYPIANQNTTFDQNGKFGQGIHLDDGTKNLIKNSSFEYAGTNTSSSPQILNSFIDGAGPCTANEKYTGITQNTDPQYVYDGSSSVEINASVIASGCNALNVQTSAALNSDITVSPGTTYTLSVYAKGGAGSLIVYGRESNSAGIPSCSASSIPDGGTASAGTCVGTGTQSVEYDFSAPGNTWTRETLTYTTPSNATTVTAFVGQLHTQAGTPVYFDAEQFEKNSSATPYASGDGASVLQYSTAASKNLIPLNSGFESGLTTPWTTNGGSNATVDTSSPYEGINSIKVNTSTLGSGQFYDVNTSIPVPVQPGTSYTFSVYSKGGNGTIYAVEYKADNATTTTSYQDHNTSVPANTNWARTSVTFMTQPDAAFVYLYLRQFQNPTPIYWDAVQFEQGSSATAYDYDTAHANINPSQGSIEFWFKPDWSGGQIAVGPTGAKQLFIATNLNPNTMWQNDISVFEKNSTAWGGPALLAAIDDSTQTSSWSASHEKAILIPTTDQLIPAGIWHHVVFTYDSSGNMKLYLDGDASKDTPYTGDTGSGIITSGGVGPIMDIGSYNTSNVADSTIDDFRIYNRVLSANEIAAHINAASETEQDAVISNLIMHEPSDATAVWSQLAWTDSLPTGTGIKFRTRSATSQSGLATSTWSPYYASSTAAITNTPDSSWIEIEATLSTTNGTATPTLSDFTLTYNVNAPPTVTINSAAQSQSSASFGKVIVSYGVSDVDDTNETVRLYYQPQPTQLTGAILSTDQPPESINVNSTTGFPSSGILSIGGETFTYDSVTVTSFHITARHTTQNEIAQNHAIGDEIFVQAQSANVVGGGSLALTAGSPNSISNQTITWNVKAELPNVYYPNASVRVLADDNEYVYSTSTADQALVIDTASPTATSIAINSGAAYTHSYAVGLNLAATDGSAVKVKISDSVDTNGNMIADGLNANSDQWINFASTISNWNLPQNGDGNYTVYYQFMDVYGNTVNQTSTTIIKSSPPSVTINSVTESSSGVVSISYTFSDAIEPPTGQSYFNVYVKYSLDGTDANLQPVTAVTGDVGSNVVATTGNKTILWTPAKDAFTNNITRAANTSKLRVYVDDLNPAITDGTNIERTGYGDYTNFVLDTQGPTSSAYINNHGDLYTQSSTVSVTFSATDESAVSYEASNYSDFHDQSSWTALAASPTTISNYALLAGDGQRYVYIRTEDAYGNITTLNNVYIYKVSPPSVTVNGVAQSTTLSKFGHVLIDYTISDAVQSSLDVTMQYYDGAGWHDVTAADVTNAGTQAVTPGQPKELIADWNAAAQLASAPIEYGTARLRVYASDGNVVPDPNQYDPYDEPGTDPNNPDTFILDTKTPQASGSAITISGETADGKIGQIQLTQGIKLDLSITDLSSMYVQFSNDGNIFGISTDNQGAISSKTSNISQGTDDFGSCNFTQSDTGCSWLTYALGNGISWAPDMTTQGNKTVYVRVRDIYGNTAIYNTTAILDTVAPTPPHFIVVDSSYYGIRYWVTVGWDLFRTTPPDSTLDPTSQEYQDELTSYNNYQDLAVSGTAYQIERKIYNKAGQLVDNSGNVITNTAITANPDTYYQKNPLVAYPKDTTQDSLIDQDLLPYDSSNPYTYYYRVESVDSVGNYSYYNTDNGWQSVIPEGMDQVPPEISSNGPSVDAKDTTATVTWMTDKLSNSLVEFSTAADYSSTNPTVYDYEQGNADDLNTVHQVQIIGLQPETSYHYRVISKSAFGKEAVSDDKTFTTTLPADSSTSPTIYTPEVQTLGTSADSVTITFKTDKYSYAQILYGTSDSNLNQSTELSTTLDKDHWITISNLTANTKYYFKARSVDVYGNETFGPLQNFTTADDNSTAAISSVIVSNVTMTSALISWTSSTVTTSDVYYGKSTSYGSSITDKSGSKTTNHSVNLQNLDQGTTYHFRIVGTDSSGANTYSSDDYVFSTITLPQIQNIKVSDVTENSMTVNWATNVATDSQVEYKIGQNQPRVEAVTDSATTHSVKLQNLDDNTDYTLRVIVRDAYGNQVISNPFDAKTAIDTTPPVITGIKAETAASINQDGKVQAIISWNTDEPSTTQVVYSLGAKSNYDMQTTKDNDLTTSHIVVIPDLQGSSAYHYRVQSADKAGNLAQSDDYIILTPQKKNSLLQIIVNNMEQQFGWLRKFGAFQ